MAFGVFGGHGSQSYEANIFSRSAVDYVMESLARRLSIESTTPVPKVQGMTYIEDKKNEINILLDVIRRNGEFSIQSDIEEKFLKVSASYAFGIIRNEELIVASAGNVRLFIITEDHKYHPITIDHTAARVN